VFGVDLRFPNTIQVAPENFSLAKGAWAYLLVNDHHLRKRDFMNVLDCSMTLVNRYYKYFERRLVTDSALAENMERIRLIMSGEVMRSSSHTVKKLSPFRDTNLRTELSKEARIVLRKLRTILLRHAKVSTTVVEKSLPVQVSVLPELSEKQLLEQALEHASSVNEVTDRFGLKRQELLLKCRTFGLTEQILRLLQRRSDNAS